MASLPATFLDGILDQPAGSDIPAYRLSYDHRSRFRLAFLHQSEASAKFTNGKKKKSERASESASMLGFELLSAHWFRKVQKSFLDVLGYDVLPGRLAQALGRQGRIHDGFDRLPDDLRRLLHEAHLRYGMRTLLESDPAPVGLAELVATRTLLSAEHVREGDWYLIEFLDGGSLTMPRQPNKLAEIVYTSIGLSSDQDGQPRRGTVLRIVPLALEDPELHALLQGLYFPQAAPPPLPQASEQETRPVVDMPRIGMSESQHLCMMSGEKGLPLTLAHQYERPGTAQARRAARMHALATMATRPTASTSPAASLRPHAAHGAGNPMTASNDEPPPFVGVNMIGAGNNMALYGRDGIVAYVDFGAPLPANANTAPASPNPCVCGDPPMILSHWDYDHYAMARMVSGAWERRWLAPQQVMGSVSARELYMRLLVAAPRGGALALWPVGTGTSHLELPFGYVERGTGRPVNDDCLAVHVRTRDDPARTAAPPWPPIFAPRPPAAPAPVTAPPGRSAIIVENGSQALWIEQPVAAHLHCAVALPRTSPLAAALPRYRRMRRHWIPASGLRLPPGIAGGSYTPVLPDGRRWPGGWAISAYCFVQLGGCIVDFPPPSFKLAVANMMCVSPTPGTIWDHPSARGAAPSPSGATWLAPSMSRWRPAWRRGGWLVPLSGPGAAALAPLPAGPVAITPAPGPAPATANEEYLLLPGDAGYQHLPSLQLRARMAGSGQALPAFVGMLATHHGSDSWIPPDPVQATQAKAHIPAAGKPKIVYSYGTRIGAGGGSHCYLVDGEGHPRAAAISAYRTFGWGTPSATGPHEFYRLNTAPQDYESAQPFNPLGLAKGTARAAANLGGHPNGNVALAPSLSGVATLIYRCPHCLQQRKYSP